MLLVSLLQGNEADFNRVSRRVVLRDAFPVFNNPKMVLANKAKNIRDQDRVIGITVGKESKAYPVAVMGSHELGNDTCGNKPIAVSW